MKPLPWAVFRGGGYCLENKVNNARKKVENVIQLCYDLGEGVSLKKE